MVKRILIVDDSSMMRHMIRDVLEKEGYDIVGVAKNGEEGVALYKTLKPDVVTMDVTMRVMDGFTATQNILALDGNAKIIFVSNLDEKKYRKDALKSGALGYVSKQRVKEIIEIIKRF